MGTFSLFPLLLPALLLFTTTPTLRRELLGLTGKPLQAPKCHRHSKPLHGAAGTFSTAPVLGYNLIPQFQFQGGVVKSTPTHLYFIWYGNWNQPLANKLAQDVLRNFTRSLSGPIVKHTATVAGWLSLTRAYTGKKGTAVNKKIALMAETTDAYSAGHSLNKTTLTQVVANAMSSGSIATDLAKGIYVVFSSPDVKINIDNQGYCGSWCAWHSQDYMTAKTKTYADVLYFIVPHPGGSDTCLNKCSQMWGGAPNGDPAVDGMVSSFAHELVEVLTDPDGNTGWTIPNAPDGENGDICFGMYGPTKNYGVNATQYNMVGLNGQPFLVQQNVDVTTKTCATQGHLSKIPYLPYTPPGKCTASKGSCLFVYRSPEFRGPPVAFQAVPTKGTSRTPATCQNVNGTIESIIVEWNMPRKNPTKIPGCAYILFWDSPDCTAGSFFYISFADYASSYGATEFLSSPISSVAIAVGDYVRSSTLSIECRSDTNA